LRAAAFPLAAAMRRRPEAYHEKLRAHERTTEPSGAQVEAADAAGATAGVEVEPGQPASIHEIVSAKQAGLSGLLHYDAYERRSGLVRVLPLETTPEAIADGSAEDLVDTLTVPW